MTTLTNALERARIGVRVTQAEAEVERLRRALVSIVNMCPATCETSTAHGMAQIALDALKPQETT